MKAEFEQRFEQDQVAARALGEDGMRMTSLRAPKYHLSVLEIFAEAEGVHLSDILREGILLAVWARQDDPTYMAALPQEARDKLAGEADRRVEVLTAALESAVSQSELFGGPKPE